MNKLIAAALLAVTATTTIAAEHNREPYLEQSPERQEMIKEFFADNYKAGDHCVTSAGVGWAPAVGTVCGSYLIDKGIMYKKYWDVLTKGQSFKRSINKQITGNVAAGWLPFVGLASSAGLVFELKKAHKFVEKKYGVDMDTDKKLFRIHGTDTWVNPFVKGNQTTKSS